MPGSQVFLRADGRETGVGAKHACRPSGGGGAQFKPRCFGQCAIHIVRAGDGVFFMSGTARKCHIFVSDRSTEIGPTIEPLKEDTGSTRELTPTSSMFVSP